jgi:hypothetical protein
MLRVNVMVVAIGRNKIIPMESVKDNLIDKYIAKGQ